MLVRRRKPAALAIPGSDCVDRRRNRTRFSFRLLNLGRERRLARRIPTLHRRPEIESGLLGLAVEPGCRLSRTGRFARSRARVAARQRTPPRRLLRPECSGLRVLGARAAGRRRKAVPGRTGYSAEMAGLAYELRPTADPARQGRAGPRRVPPSGRLRSAERPNALLSRSSSCR